MNKKELEHLKNKKTYTINRLESMLQRMTDLPLYINSCQKKERKHGREILQKICDEMFKIIKLNDVYCFMEGSCDPFWEFPKYLSYIENQDYKNASEFAREWYKDVRDDKHLTYEFQNKTKNVISSETGH